jgi:hypothetical protein
MAMDCSLGVKPLIHQSELSSPFSRKKLWTAMLRKTPTLKIARSSPRNSVFIGHASNPP